MSRRLHDADLLVITRALDREIFLSAFHYYLIHIYDYAGLDYDALIRSVDHSKTFIFCTAESRKQRLTGMLDFPADQVFVAMPPVKIKMWSNKMKTIKYEMVHIGNYKIINDIDITGKGFNDAIIDNQVQVWGSGWKMPKKFYHGKAGLFQVSGIYSQSEFAFGLMYPFQREVTFSGRFWHAPLNGCTLLSEPGYFTLSIPGIVETDYSPEDIKAKTRIKPDRGNVQEKAIKFWEEQNKRTLSFAESTLCIIKRNNYSASKFLTYFYIKIFNILFKYYQKSGLSGVIVRR